VARGAVLAPSASRRTRWGSSAEDDESEDDLVRLFPVDRLAGDDRSLFFTPCKPLHGDHCAGLPTVAFALDDLFGTGRVGLRPHDLLRLYSEARESIGWNLGEPEAEIRQMVARIAACTTTWDPLAVRSYVDAYARFLAARTPGIRARASAQASRALTRYEPCLRELGWSGDERLEGIPQRSPILHLLGEPGTSGTIDSDGGPEVLLEASLPLPLARFAFDIPARRWRTMPEIERQAKRRAVEPQRDVDDEEDERLPWWKRLPG
jgi:hypothetical protein